MMNATTIADLGRCAGCEWTGPTDALPPLTDIFERVVSGELLPAGQCPECGSAVHCDGDVADTTLDVVAEVMRRRGWLVVAAGAADEMATATHERDGKPFVPEHCTRAELQSALDVTAHLLNDFAEGEAAQQTSWESLEATFEIARTAFPALYEERRIANGVEADEEAEDVAGGDPVGT